MASTADTIGQCVKRVEYTFRRCKFSQHKYTNCAVRQHRPIHHGELTGADAEAEAPRMVTAVFVRFRSALAYALSTQ
eukprot:7942655-Pyramimonas_sp.AAC.1